MSAVYNLEPQPTAKVLLETTSGDVTLELFAKQTPLTSRNFLQLCLDGYYNNTIFHRLVSGFVIQGGDPTGTGEGGEAIYDGGLFEDEFHSRLKFNRRGLLGMANTGKKNDNGSQFFLTLGATPELEGRNTMFGRVVGDTIYNLMKMGEVELVAEDSDRPLYPTKITGTEILVNPFDDMVKRDLLPSRSRPDKPHDKELKKKSKKKGGKILLSFEDDGTAEVGEAPLKKAKFNPKLVPAGTASDEGTAKDTKPYPGSEPRVNGMESRAKSSPKDCEEKPKEKASRRKSHKSLSPPPFRQRSPETQLPLPHNEEPSRSPTTSPEPDQVGKVSSLLDRTNAQIAELKASMKRNVPTASTNETRKKSVLEQMIPENATRGRKRKHGANGDMSKDKQSLDILKAFRAKLDSAPPASVEPDAPTPEAQGIPAQANGNVGVDDDEEAALCDLHFIVNCQSCQSWDKHLLGDLDVADDDGNGWMSHALNFGKDRLGKDLNWKKKGEDDLVVIDPREKAKDLKEEQRAKRQKGGDHGGRAWDKDRDKGRMPDRRAGECVIPVLSAGRQGGHYSAGELRTNRSSKERFDIAPSSPPLLLFPSIDYVVLPIHFGLSYPSHILRLRHRIPSLTTAQGSLKRPAPGASPIAQTSQPLIDPLPPAQMSSKRDTQWTRPNQPSSFSSQPESYPMPSINRPLLSQNSTQPPQSSSNQLTRRPPTQELAQAQRDPYLNSRPENWPSVTENSTQQLSEVASANNGDELDQKALIAKGDAQAKRKAIPPFVQKLSRQAPKTEGRFLDESRNTDLIRWSENGDSFIVIDEEEFARTLIPELFKHKNYASFVRQLNMYGFHKKVGLSDNSMRASERKNRSPSEYSNPYFKRGRPNLLWLIHKPRNTSSRGNGRGGRGRQEDGTLDDDVEDIYDIEQPTNLNLGSLDASATRQGRQPLLIGNGGTGNSPQDLTAVHEGLQAVRKQQQLIASLLQKTRAEHEQLYGQAASFQKLHDRHESSINAILTFLATIYKQPLEGKGGPNFGGMFGTISQDSQGQGNVVNKGDYGSQSMVNGSNQGLFRRQPLLLGAPPNGHQQGSLTSPAVTADSPALSTQDRLYPERSPGGASSPVAQEIFDTPSNRSSLSPQVRPDPGNNGQPSKADILSMIQSSNASQPFQSGSHMDFHEVLSHLQTADGQLPLTPNQRNDALRLMASTAGDTSANGENALTSPSPAMPDMAHYQQSQDRLDQLSNALKEQDSKVNQLSSVLAPLSPSGSIPGITDTQNYGDPGANDLLDLDQIFSNDYFNDNATGDFSIGSNEALPDFNFDATGGDDAEAPLSFGFDGTADDADGGPDSPVETVHSSEVTSPANTIDENNAVQEDSGRSRKRRKKG
ncbi:MAG: hypothetical protein Q9170_006090 [Blastenia crenularia]